MPMLDLSELRRRRQKFLSNVTSSSLVILIAAPECLRNGDVYYPYRPNSHFYYLTAFSEPDAVALLVPDAREGKLILFNRSNDPAETVWVGPRIGQKKACLEYGVNEAYPINELEKILPDYLTNEKICFYLGSDKEFDRGILARINALLIKLHRQPIQYSAYLTDILCEMRLKKSTVELDCLRKAAAITGAGHIRAMKACRPRRYEYHLEAELLHAFYEQGSRFIAYPSIVASGANACTLHYTDNQAELQSGDLVLVDAGCEYQYYASDITRTFPVNGRFSSEQKAIYDIVLQVQEDLITKIRPGLAWNELQAACVLGITEGLVNLGLLKGKVSDLLRQQAYRRFYMHGCSHWLGLDVHDVGSYKKDEKWRTLESDMVFTVEPGIYIRKASDIDEKWWDIGIRIEDDVRVTTDACEVLSQSVPKTINMIESFMRS